MNATDERILLQRARSLDQKTLAQIYDHFSSPVYRYAFRLLGDTGLAEDCVADTFDRFLTSLAQGGGPQKYLQAYLFRTAHNWVVDFYRKQESTKMVELEDGLASSHNTQDQVSSRWEQSHLRKMVLKLPDEQRQVVILRYLEEWPLEKVAETMNKTVGAVKAMQHRALASLQRLWEDTTEGKNE